MRRSAKDGGGRGESGKDRGGGKPTLVVGVPQLKCDLLALVILTEQQTPPRRQLMAQRQAVAYILGDASGLVFRLMLWVQGKLVSESG